MTSDDFIEVLTTYLRGLDPTLTYVHFLREGETPYDPAAGPNSQEVIVDGVINLGVLGGLLEEAFDRYMESQGGDE